MRVHGGVDVYIPGTHCTGGWVGSKTSLDDTNK
jgi:hypothetical protein